MHILMVSNTYFPIVGGLEASIKRFTEELRKKGHQVSIVVPELEGDETKDPNTYYLPAIKNIKDTQFSINYPIAPELLKFTDKLKPDIIHSHHPFLMGDLAIRLARYYEVPIILTYHTMFEYYLNSLGIDKKIFQEFIIHYVTGYTEIVDHIIVPTESVKQILLERQVKTNMTVIPTGIDTKKFSKKVDISIRDKYSLSPSQYLIGTIGRFSDEKNMSFLTKCIIQTLQTHSDTVALYVGDGPDRQKLEKMIQDAGVSERVIFTGILKGDDLIAAYQALDLFLFASKSETQGLVLVESMAAGTPVVGLDANAVRDIIQHKKNGRLVKEETVEQYCAEVNAMIRQKESERKKVEKNLKKTVRQYSKSFCADKLIKLYQHVIQKHEDHTERNDQFLKKYFGRALAEIRMFDNLVSSIWAGLVETGHHKTESKK